MEIASVCPTDAAIESGLATNIFAGGWTASSNGGLVIPSALARSIVVPGKRAVTTPSRFTDATVGLLEEYVNRLGSLLESYFVWEGHPTV
jgi:hypothetical protein